MAWTTALSSLAAGYFAGGKRLPDRGSFGLVAKYNLIITRVNEVIDALSDGTEDLEIDNMKSDTLDVGTDVAGYVASESWMLIDGTRPPVMSRVILLDTIGGTPTYVQVTGAAVVAVPV